VLRVDEDRVCSVPRQWTDLVAPDPKILVTGVGRSLLRVTDLMELSELVSRLVEEELRTERRKVNDAASVKQTPPPGARVRRGLRRTT
jgi:hypothetical protein